MPTRNTKIDKVFSDIDLDFFTNPFTGDIYIKYDTESVKRSIYNLIFTKTGERPFQPELGSGLKYLLFENYGSVEMLVVKNKLEDLIKTYEPRISFVSVEFEENIDQNSVVITIFFQVINNPEVDQLQLDIERIR